MLSDWEIRTAQNLFNRRSQLPELLYEQLIEVDERMTAEGQVLRPVDLGAARRDLEAAYAGGIRSAAIVFVHGYRYPEHEELVAELAREVGFTQISVSHRVIPLMKLVSRGDTTVVDAYVSPLLSRYVRRLSSELGDTQLLRMQSNGGLVDGHRFHGKDAILPGRPGHRRRGAHRGSGRLRQDHLVRHGRHLHRRCPL